MSYRSKPESCIGCDFYSAGVDFSQIEGTGSSGVMMVGEASGEAEARDQLPFRPYAPSGSVLERVIRRMGHDRQEFSITNACRCRPKNNWLEGNPREYAALAHCRPNLEQAIRDRRPRAILALGGVATRELTGLAGKALGVSHLAGYVLPHIIGPAPQDNMVDTVPVIPNFHPAFLRRGKASYQGLFARVLQRALNVASGKDTSYLWNVNPEDPDVAHALGYQTRPTVASALAYSHHVLSHPLAVVSYDLETNESASLDEDARDGFADTHIRLVQFTVEGAGSIAIPWEPEFYGIVQSILHAPNTKCGHNVWLFDNKVLRAAGQRQGLDLLPRGIIHDTLQMFHHWQPDLPAHLQAAAAFVQFPFPWKHMSGVDAHLAFYGCCDVDATLRLYTMLRATLTRDDLWGDETRGYLGQVLTVRPILAAMEDRGMPIDDAARLRLDAEFDIAQRALGVELASRAPASCQRVHPKDGYKGVPPEVKAAITLASGEYDTTQRFYDQTAAEKESGVSGEWYAYQCREFSVTVTDAVTGEPVAMPTTRWCRVYDFNPNSRTQVIAYMRAQGHPIPKDKHRENDEGENPETTNEKELRRLATKTGDDFYLKVIEYRGFTKLRGTYIAGFAPAADGCVHTTFTFDTAIAQLSCCAPWTPVNTARGEVPISDVKVGDFVWTHRKRWRQVTATWNHPDAPMVSVHLSNGQVLTCTTLHRVLLSSHGRKQEMADRRQYREGSESIPECIRTYATRHSESDGNTYPSDLLGLESPHAASGVQSPQQTALLALQNGQEESTVWEDGGSTSPLDRGSGGWTRIFNLLSERETRVCSSSHNGQGPEAEDAASDLRCAPHQRRQEGQSSGQLSVGYQIWPRRYSLASTWGFQGVAIEKIISMGSVPVHDITVDEDESYASCGVFSHNSRNPNIQNFTKLKPTPQLAKAMRGMVRAKPGRVLTEWDYKSCHVLTLGFLAQDPQWMRLARLDMHSFIAGHLLNQWDCLEIIKESDAELLARFRWLKSDPDRKRVRDDQAKHGILGIGNGLKAKGLYERYMESFPPRQCPRCAGQRTVPGVRGPKRCPECQGIGLQPGIRIAERVLEIAELIGPRVFVWQRNIVKQAHEQQALRTEFGHQRRFYEVFRWDPRRMAMVHGDQAEEAIAYWLSNVAHSHMRETMKAIHAAGYAERYGLFSQIHDALLFHFDAELLDDHVRDIHPIMVAPSKVLRNATAPGGLVIECEASVGEVWNDMKEITLPKLVKATATVAEGAIA